MNKLFEVTWTVFGSKTHRCQNVQVVTKMHARSIIRQQEMANGDEIKDFISVKEWREVA